jgi:hypothetical protein
MGYGSGTARTTPETGPPARTTASRGRRRTDRRDATPRTLVKRGRRARPVLMIERETPGPARDRDACSLPAGTPLSLSRTHRVTRTDCCH